MLVYYAVTDMGFFDNDSDSIAWAKNEGKGYYYLSFACCPMYHFQSNKICHINIYCKGMVEVIRFKVRCQGY